MSFDTRNSPVAGARHLVHRPAFRTLLGSTCLANAKIGIIDRETKCTGVNELGIVRKNRGQASLTIYFNSRIGSVMPISGKATVTGSKINYLGKALSSEKNLVPNTLDERVWRVDLAAVKIKGDFS